MSCSVGIANVNNQSGGLGGQAGRLGTDAQVVGSWLELLPMYGLAFFLSAEVHQALWSV